MRVRIVLERVLLMGSSVFGWSLLMARRIDSKAYAIFPYIEYYKTDIAGLQGSAGENRVVCRVVR